MRPMSGELFERVLGAPTHTCPQMGYKLEATFCLLSFEALSSLDRTPTMRALLVGLTCSTQTEGWKRGYERAKERRATTP